MGACSSPARKGPPATRAQPEAGAKAKRGNVCVVETSVKEECGAKLPTACEEEEVVELSAVSLCPVQLHMSVALQGRDHPCVVVGVEHLAEKVEVKHPTGEISWVSCEEVVQLPWRCAVGVAGYYKGMRVVVERVTGTAILVREADEDSLLEVPLDEAMDLDCGNYRMTIAGEAKDAEGSFEVTNPATGRTFATAPEASHDDVDRAVERAYEAFALWEKTPLEERKGAVSRALAVLLEHRDELAELICKEQGKPLAKDAADEIDECVAVMEHALQLTPKGTVCMDTPWCKVVVERRAIGVVAGITPWNFPLAMCITKMAPAVVLGNTFVCKPSPYTPLSTLRFVELVQTCFPPGVVSCVTASTKAIGERLVAHPRVGKVSFTGSCATGKAIMKVCAEGIKRVTLEMGGNDAAIVRRDCDVASVARGVFNAAFANCGQVCVAVKRVYVHESIFTPFVNELVKCARSVVVGEGMDPATDMGPLNNLQQLERIERLVKEAKELGGKVVVGGKRLERSGYFYPPTIVTGVEEGVPLVDEEQFGPVLPVMPYSSDNEAVARANASRFGLGGSVWSADVDEAHRMAVRLQAGTVWVNEHMADTGNAPFGGFRESGLGRECGEADIDAYTEMQTVKTMREGEAPLPPMLPEVDDCDVPFPSTFHLVINGELVEGDGEGFEVLNPATGKGVAVCPSCSAEQVDAAVEAAKDAFPGWAATSIGERRRCLQSALSRLLAHRDRLAELICKEQGKPKGGETPPRCFVGASLEVFFCAGLINQAIALDEEETILVDDPMTEVRVAAKALGVVAGITPWNFPLAILLIKLAPAVVLGNTFVCKPSPYTPLSALAFFELVHDCFPPGVLNVVVADDSSFRAGAHLTAHPDVAKVSFTGSVATGKAIMASCADHVTRLTLELGGNDAAIVREDCDVEKVAQGVFKGAFNNTGQVCMAIKRVYVHRSIFEAFVQAIARCAESASFGDGLDPTTDYGPLCNEMQLSKVEDIVNDAKAHGATVVTGGHRRKGSEGYFYEPTIVTGVEEGVRLVDEEQFGPVLPIMPYDTDAEAVRRANASQYGLGGSVWSADLDKANALVQELRAGSVWVNEHFGDTGLAPFGGFAQSGLGREGGFANLIAYTELQTVKVVKDAPSARTSHVSSHRPSMARQ